MAKPAKAYLKLIGLPEPEKRDFWTLFGDSQAQRSTYQKAFQKSTEGVDKRTRKRPGKFYR